MANLKHLDKSVLELRDKVEGRINKRIKILENGKLHRGAQVLPDPNIDNCYRIEYSPNSRYHRDYLIVHECLHLIRDYQEPEEFQMKMDASQEEKDTAYQELYSVAGEHDLEGIRKSPLIPSRTDAITSPKKRPPSKKETAHWLLDTLSRRFKSSVFDVWVSHTVAEGHLDKDIHTKDNIINQQISYYLNVLKVIDQEYVWKPQTVNWKWFLLMTSLNLAFYKLIEESVLGDHAHLSKTYFKNPDVIETGNKLKELYTNSMPESPHEERNILDSWAKLLNVYSWYHWEPLHAQ